MLLAFVGGSALEGAAKLVEAAGKGTLSFIAFIVLVVAFMFYRWFGREKLWVRGVASSAMIGCIFAWIFILAAPKPSSPEPVPNSHLTPDPSPPKPVSEAPLQITPTPLNIDFPPRQFGGPRSGCDCNSSDIVFPSGSIQGKPNQELKFQWDAAPICHGQAFENFNGHIFVGGQSLQLPNNNNNSQFPGIAGTMNLKFSRPYVGEAAVGIFLNCVDKGSANCSRGCQAHGDVEVHIQ